MQLWRAIPPAAVQTFRGAVVTIGNFDGLHLGHRALFAKAREFSGPRIVITFDPHPLQVLQPDKALKRLFPREDLAEQLPGFGVDLLVVLNFTLEFAAQSANEFLNRCLMPFEPEHVVAGYDFHFGKGREGSAKSLRNWCEGAGCELHVVPPLLQDGAPVSSSRVRGLISAGKVEEAARLLGRSFYLRGPVVSGAGRGAKIGVPTLNQDPVNETLPRQGVYATRTRCRGMILPSVTNIGVNPTFGGRALKVETHVISGSCEARGETIDVEFVARLRSEISFSGIEDLKKQIQSDILKARKLLGAE